MPGMSCKCGEILRWGDIPNRLEWLIISDVEYDKYEGMVDSEELFRAFKSMMECPKCKRLYVFWRGFQENPFCYELDEDY